eukprot:TRINITY_DN100492_c0_g1_i1.p1 TRINITY_DN100492_c0_g1~~TRINITY_DN100492_c0_g1_i1.p1  ORF type:complete len:1136 (-),score=353.18 TRINITY_DN100492_c0_g1_i1:226-3633(-)
MAPKKKVDDKPAEAELLPGPADEVDEEAEDTVTFEVKFGAVSNLPVALETKLSCSGHCKELRSEAHPASSSPGDWVFEKSTFIRKKSQDLYDFLANTPIKFTLTDVSNFQVIGEASLDLTPLLQDTQEVAADVQFTLRPDYLRKWAPTPEDGSVPEAPAPETVAATMLRVTVTVPELVGPAEDRESWTLMTLCLDGVYGLPERLSRMGLTGAEDVENHQFLYRVSTLGLPLTEVAGLSKPAEEKPEGTDETTAEPSDDDWRETQQRYGLSIQFPQAKRIVVYRGASFLADFRKMLNETGGVWIYLAVEEKPSSDPKKPNPPELAALAKHFAGKIWLDLTALARPGAKCTGGGFSAVRHSLSELDDGEPTYESARTFARLAMELSHDAAPPARPEQQVPLPVLLPDRPPVQKFSSSGDAVALYKEAISRSFEEVVSSTTGPFGGRKGPGGIEATIAALKKSGKYEEVKQDIRSAVVQVCRERLRKDTAVVPGKDMEKEVRGKFIADSYSYLKSTMLTVLDDIREAQPETVTPEAHGRQAVHAAPSTPGGESAAGTKPRSADTASEVGGRRGSNPQFRGLQSVPEPSESGYTEGMLKPRKLSQSNATEDVEVVAAPMNPVAVALAESAATRNARQALEKVSDAALRSQRLAAEAEMSGKYDRAAALAQNRLVLAEFKDDPAEWVNYAKLCMRARGRQAAAEEALRQAVQLLASGVEHTPEMALEVDLMLACLLLDRDRHSDAIQVFRVWHEKDFAAAQHRFFLGLALFLSGEPEDGTAYLESAAKPREWFEGLQTEVAVVEKLNASRAADGPPAAVAYSPHLEQLLDFGLSQLVFTFIDQTEVLKQASAEAEPIAIYDARAAMLEGDYTAAASRLEQVIAAGNASRDAWRLAGDCHFHLQDYERALQVLQTSLSMGKVEDPVGYIRLGHVLLQKKRWKQARDAFLKAIGWQPTAEAWCGVGYAEYRSEELQTSYEALCEAVLLDGERADLWAQLALVHIKMETFEKVDGCMAQCLSRQADCDELLLEVAAEMAKHGERFATTVEACARRALEVKNSGQAHATLADALAARGQVEEAVREAQMAIRLLVDWPDLRKGVYERALKWAESWDASQVENLHALQKQADADYLDWKKMMSSE